MDVMIDIETLGTSPGCVIWEIAALCFDPLTGKTGEHFRVLIDVPDSVEWGLVIEDDTARWWQERGGIQTAGAKPLKESMIEFINWMEGQNFESVWCKGASFDFPILQVPCDILDLQLPFAYYQQRCARTVCKLAHPNKRPIPATHAAFEDCAAQVHDLCLALRALGLTERGAA